MGIRERLETLSRGELIGLVVVVAVTMAGAGLWYVRSLPKPVSIAAGAPPAGAVPAEGAVASTAPSPTGPPIIVDVTGWVHEPGVYEFAQGERVIDAVERAGGARNGADLSVLNLAAPLTDGTQVVVPKEGAAPAGTVPGETGGGTTSGLVNISQPMSEAHSASSWVPGDVREDQRANRQQDRGKEHDRSVHAASNPRTKLCARGGGNRPRARVAHPQRPRIAIPHGGQTHASVAEPKAAAAQLHLRRSERRRSQASASQGQPPLSAKTLGLVPCLTVSATWRPQRIRRRDGSRLPRYLSGCTPSGHRRGDVGDLGRGEPVEDNPPPRDRDRPSMERASTRGIGSSSSSLKRSVLVRELRVHDDDERRQDQCDEAQGLHGASGCRGDAASSYPNPRRPHKPPSAEVRGPLSRTASLRSREKKSGAKSRHPQSHPTPTIDIPGGSPTMTETSTLEAELEQVREGLRTVDLETARAEISKAGAGVIKRFEVGHTMDSTNAEFIGATFSLLATEAIARLLTLAESGDLDSPEAEAMVSGVGGALDAAQRCFEQRDTEGARRFIEAAMDVLGL